MNKKRTIIASAGLCVLAICSSALADGQLKGKIKICRIAGEGSGVVYLPADGTYGGDCDDTNTKCSIIVGVTAASTLKPGASACTTLDAVLESGQAPAVGHSLIAQWNTGSLASRTTVVQAFK